MAVEFQALVYDILPPTTVITDYTIGLEKLSANGQILSSVSLITARFAYASTGKTQIA